MNEDGNNQGPNANIYRAPDAELLDKPASEAEFYIVAPHKFVLLYLGTWGLYEIYWFYRHWRLYRDSHGLKLWPVPRAIFSIFFAYPLFSRIADRGGETGGGQWSPGWYSVAYILLYIIGNLSQFPEPGPNSGVLVLISLISLLLLAALLYRVQCHANAACGDPQGESNSRYDWANYFWLAIGALLWLTTILAVAEIFGLLRFDA